MNPHKAGGGANAEDLITECARCDETVKHLTGVQMTKGQVWDRVKELPVQGKRHVLAWMKADLRPLSPAEKVWGMYRQLPAAVREELEGDLVSVLKS
ncbi:hypothetical protein [Streptomyces zaomyceticus]|uniref:hypothetical protein n=1 Tax=Streptomyces zaomyceticus TaxID=68286 RepID=UPI0016731556|nr:hypothetical protein [Streptomyces zaomyceticus]